MADTLPIDAFGLRLPGRRNGLNWAVAFSILLHVAIGWYFVSRLVLEQQFHETVAIPVTVEAAPPIPRVEPPEITTEPEAAKEKPREKIHVPPPVTGAAAVESSPLEPAPPVEAPGPVVPQPAPATPAAAPKPTLKIQPVYPDKALEADKNGEVEVYITVSAGGAVSDVQIVRETPRNYGFGKAAVAAVSKWEFADAAPGTYRVTVKFKLD